jgi:hypothetical protein
VDGWGLGTDRVFNIVWHMLTFGRVYRYHGVYSFIFDGNKWPCFICFSRCAVPSGLLDRFRRAPSICGAPLELPPVLTFTNGYFGAARLVWIQT